MLEQKMNLPLTEYLNLRNVWFVWFACFAIVSLLNFSCLFNQPYWDDILGLHNQAIFLADNHFDIAKLWAPGQQYSDGGSNIYRLGMMPFFYGVLYSILKPEYVHLTGHLFNIACLSIAFSLFFMILRKYLPPWTALLWCIAALCEPVMAGRTAGLGQESPLIALAAAAIYCIAFQRIWLALIFILTASFIKPTAGLLTFAAAAWLLAGGLMSRRLFIERFRGRWMQYLIGSIAVSLIIAGMSAYILNAEPYESSPSLNFLCNKALFVFSNLLPVQTILMAGVIVTAVTSTWRLRVKKVLWKDWISFYLLILLAGFWLAFILFPASLPRYTGFAVFPTCAFIALNIRNRYCSVAAAGLVILMGITTMDGKLYPALHSRSGEYLERSREYIADLRSNAAICGILEKKASLNPVVAKWPFVQMLTMPELGYVTNQLPRVYAVGILPKYTSAKPFPGFKNMPDNTLYVYASNSFEAWGKFGPSLQPSSRDQIVGSDSTLGGLLLVYRKK
jgi:hypothetical protein